MVGPRRSAGGGVDRWLWVFLGESAGSVARGAWAVFAASLDDARKEGCAMRDALGASIGWLAIIVCLRFGALGAASQSMACWGSLGRVVQGT